MEPLALMLRKRGGEWGIPLGDGTHIVSLYADDLLLYIRDISNIPESVAQTLNEFANLSGLKVNWAKTCLFSFDSMTLNPLVAPT